MVRCIKKISIIAVLVMVSGWLYSQNISKIEYFIDTDPGFRSGTAVTGWTASADVKNFTFGIDVSSASISNGFHKLYIRCYDDSSWSTTVQRTFYKQDVPVLTNPYKVTKLEYFFNDDPGFGAGTSVPVTTGAIISNQAITIDVAGLTDGFHKFTIRAKDDKNSWSQVQTRNFYKYTFTPASTIKITQVEYFFDTDPGVGQGLPMTFTQDANVQVASDLALSSLTSGFHKLYVRAKDQNGAWSTTNTCSFYSDIVPSSTLPNIVYGEYFIDTDPGFGKGKSIDITASSTIADKTFAVDLIGVTTGFHKLNVRFKDAQNRWSTTPNKLFYMEQALSSTLPNITSGEYYIDTDPGYGKATSITGLSGGTQPENVVLSIDLNSITPGFHKLYMRAKDANNSWGQTLVRTFYKDNSVPNVTAQISEIKYYIGQGKNLDLTTGILVADLTPSDTIKDLIFQVDLTGKAVGNYYLYANAKNLKGQYSHTVVDSFKICNNVSKAKFSHEVASRTVTFTDLSQLAAEYKWDFGDGTYDLVSNEANPIHEYPSNGSYNVCLTVKNDCNESTFCDSVTVTYNASPVSNGFNVMTNENTSYTFASDNFYYNDEEGNAMDHILITAMSLGQGDSLLLDSVVMEVDSIIKKEKISKLVYIPASNQAGFRGSLNFKVHDGISYSPEYTINFNVTAINGVPTFNISNKAIVVMEISDGVGTFNIEDWLTDLDDGDPDENQTLSGYALLIDGANLFSIPPQLLRSDYSELYFVINPNVTGKARLKVQITDQGQNPYSNTVEKEFTIEIAQFKAKLASAKTEYCSGDEVLFTSTSPSEGINFAWNFGEGATPKTFVGVTPPPVVYGTSGIKTVKLTIQGNGKTDDETLSINILDKPDASFLTGSIKFPLNDTVFFANTSVGGSSFEWDFGDGSAKVIKTNTSDVKHKYVAKDKDTFTPVLTAINGSCKDEYQQLITFIDAVPPTIVSENFASTYSFSETKKVSVTASDAFYTITNAKFYFKGVSSNQWGTRTITKTGDNVFEATIEETMGDQVGIAYYFDVFNSEGLKRKSSVGYAYLEFKEGLEIPSLISGATVNDYQIVAVPLDLTSRSVDTIFDELGSYDNTKWRLFHYNPTKLLEYKTDFQELEKGKGYWFITRDAVKINTGKGTTASGTNFEEYKIPLRDGWTQIGNPYIFDVDWQDILDANPEDVDKIGKLRIYSHGSWKDTTVLSKFRGGFVYCSESGVELTIPVTKTSSKKSAIISQTATLTPNNWIVNMQLSTKNIKNSNIGFGMNEMANDSKDKFDDMTIPRFFNYLEANFNHPEYFYPNFASDIVAPKENYIWNFTVETNQTDEITSLSWDKETAAALPNEMKLVDTRTQQVVDMKNVSKYGFISDNSRAFKVFYGSKAFIDSTLVFKESVLGDCYPNPFSNSTIIPLYIPGSSNSTCKIELSVYSIDGRKIGNIAEGDYQGGFHEILWDPAKSIVGLKSGIYFYTLTNFTEKTTVTKRMEYIK